MTHKLHRSPLRHTRHTARNAPAVCELAPQPQHLCLQLRCVWWDIWTAWALLLRCWGPKLALLAGNTHSTARGNTRSRCRRDRAPLVALDGIQGRWMRRDVVVRSMRHDSRQHPPEPAAGSAQTRSPWFKPRSRAGGAHSRQYQPQRAWLHSWVACLRSGSSSGTAERSSERMLQTTGYLNVRQWRIERRNNMCWMYKNPGGWCVVLSLACGYVQHVLAAPVCLCECGCCASIARQGGECHVRPCSAHARSSGTR
jgi:hypothetical protein